MSQKEQRKRHELDLLCKAGVGLTLIAPEVCRLVRDIIGCQACALFWLQADGKPEGFFHEESGPGTQELFLNEFDRLFVGGPEVNVFSLAHTPGQRVGHLFRPDASYYQSNTFNLLVRASGHHHCLDLRLDVDGRARAVLLLFRPVGQPFQPDDATLLNRLASYLERAIGGRQADLKSGVWAGLPERTGHMLLSADGGRVLMACTQADALLRRCTLVGQNVQLDGALATPPLFVRQLCQQLMARAATAPEAEASARLLLDIPGGQLSISVSRMNTCVRVPPDVLTTAAPADAPGQLLVVLALVQPSRLQVVQRVLDLGLSPLQREIALLAGVGGQRSDCERVIGVSNEALKKHLRTIYSSAGADSWGSLASRLSQVAMH